MFSLIKIAHSAQDIYEGGKTPSVPPVLGNVINIIVVPAIELIFILATLIFIWGVFGLISKGDDPTARKDGQNHILWGVVGMFIMISAYGIIKVIANTLGFNGPL